MEFDFLEPLDNNLIIEIKQLSTQHLSSKVVFHTQTEFPDISKIKIALIGVLENRGDNQSNLDNDLTLVRKQLYSLYPGNWSAAIADLGDIKPGNSIEDTYYALQSIVSKLMRKNIVPIIIGGSQDLTYAIYRSYDNLDQMVNLVAIDARFDFGKQQDTVFAESYLSKIVLDEPTNLFNYTNVGFQTYYNSQEEIDLVDKMFFDVYRLGEISNNIALAEPIFRDADCVSLDLNAVKSSASGNFNFFQPNGFNGKEICALARYAGISDKVSVMGLFNHTYSKNESVLIAQIIWYFIEGFNFRSNEYPFESKENYLKYIIPFDDQELIFYKSNKTDRWWIEIEQEILNSSNKTKKKTLLPCSYEEYLQACNKDFPERWWKFQRKSLI